MDPLSETDDPSYCYRHPPTRETRSFLSTISKRICCCFTTTDEDLYIHIPLEIPTYHSNTDDENDSEHDETEDRREKSAITFASHVELESSEIQTLVPINLEPIVNEEDVSLPIEPVDEPVITSAVTPPMSEHPSLTVEINISNEGKFTQLTDEDTTVGDATVGDATVGDATIGDATVGDATIGDATVGDATDGDATVKNSTLEEVPRKESVDSIVSTMTNAEKSYFYSKHFLQLFVDQIMSDNVQFSSADYKEQENQSSSSKHLKITSVNSGSELAASIINGKKRPRKRRHSKKNKRDRSESVPTFRVKYRMPSNFDIEDHVRNNKNPYPGLASQLRENNRKRVIDSYGNPVNFIRQGDKDFADVVVPAKSNLIAKLFDLYTFEDVANVKVVIGDRDYFCHLIILQTYSQYFELKVGVKTYNLPPAQVSAFAFGQIYNWMTGGPDGIRKIRGDDIIDIYAAAKFLKIRILESQILSILINASEFSEERAFYVYKKAKQFEMTNIQKIMMRRIRAFFLRLVGSRNFVELSIDDLRKLLSSDRIEANCELEIFLAAVRWLRFDWKQRKNDITWVMACVRFELIDYMQLMSLKHNSENNEIDFILENRKVQRMMQKGMAYYICKYVDDDTKPSSTEMQRKVDFAKSRKRMFTGLNKVYNTYTEFLCFLSECSNTTESVHESLIGSEQTGPVKTYSHDINDVPPVELVGQSWYNINRHLLGNNTIISESSLSTILQTQCSELNLGNLNKPGSMDILQALMNFSLPPRIETNDELFDQDENDSVEAYEHEEYNETVLDDDATESIDKGNTESVIENPVDSKRRFKIPKYLREPKRDLIEQQLGEPDKPMDLNSGLVSNFLKSKHRLVQQTFDDCANIVGVKEGTSSKCPNNDDTRTDSTSPNKTPTTYSVVKNYQTKQGNSKSNQSDVVNIFLYSHDDVNKNERTEMVSKSVNTEQNQTMPVSADLQIDPNTKQRSAQTLNSGDDFLVFASDEKILSRRTPRIVSDSVLSYEDSMSRNELGINDKNLSTTDLKYDVYIPIPIYSLKEPISDTTISGLNDPGISLLVNPISNSSSFQKDGDQLVLQAEIKKPNQVSGLQAVFEKGHKALELKQPATHNQRTYEEATAKLQTTVGMIVNIIPTSFVNVNEPGTQVTANATSLLKPILKHESAYSSESDIKCQQSQDESSKGSDTKCKQSVRIQVQEESTNDSDTEYKQSVKLQPRGKIPRRRYIKPSKKFHSIEIYESKRPVTREVLTSTTDSESDNATKSHLAATLIKPNVKRSAFNVTEPKPNELNTDSMPQEPIYVEEREEHVALKPDDNSRANSTESVNRRNGTYYKKLMLAQCDELNQIADKYNKLLNDNDLVLSESTTGLIRAATGNAHILTTKKMAQFEKLCNQNLGIIPTDIGFVHDIDLESWWEVVMTEIQELENKFKNIDSLLDETKEN